MSLNKLKEEALLYLDIKGVNPMVSTKFSKLRTTLFLGMDCFVGCLLFAGLFTTSFELDDLVEAVTAVSSVSQALIKQSTLILYRDHFKKVLEGLKEFWPTTKFGKKSEGKILSIEHNTVTYLTTFKYMVLVSCTAYCLKPVLETKRTLPLSFLLLCDTNGDACYILNYTLMVYAIFTTAVCLIAIDLIFFAVLANIYCELEQIKYAIANFNSEIDTLVQAGHTVEHHNLVLGYIQIWSNLFNAASLYQFATHISSLCGGLFVLTVNGFPPTRKVFFKMVPYLITVSLEIVLFCVAGELIAAQTESVADAAYESKWVDKCQPKLRRLILLVIQRSQRRMQLMAGGIWNLNMETCVGIMKLIVVAFVLSSLLEVYLYEIPDNTCKFNQDAKKYFCVRITNQFPNMEYLDFDLECVNCEISTFSKDTFPVPTELASLKIRNSKINEVTSKAFENLQNLKYLYLDYNGIANLHENTFYGINGLFELHLEKNRIRNLTPGFLSNCNATSVDLSQNNLREILDEAFRGSHGIMALDLSYNSISYLHSNSLRYLNHLEGLYLKNNWLETLPIGVFKHVRDLKTLNLAHNKFTKIPFGLFSPLNDLYQLDISYNNLIEFNADMMLPFRNIHLLDISRNGLVYLDVLSLKHCAPTLDALVINDNFWTCPILSDIVRNSKIHKIDVSDHSLERYDALNINGITCVYGEIPGNQTFQDFIRRSYVW